MKIKVVMYDLEPYKLEFLKADLEYLKAEMKFEVFETLEKIKNNKMLSLKVLNIINKYNPFGTQITSIEDILKASLEVLKSLNVVEYEIHEDENYVTFYLTISDLYFEVIKKCSFGLPVFTKSDLLRKLKKNIKKTYGNKFTIEEIE